MATILIIEDDHALAEGLTRALSTEQIQAENCSTLKEAEKLLAGHDYDLVLLDINLPDGSGFELHSHKHHHLSHPRPQTLC